MIQVNNNSKSLQKNNQQRPNHSPGLPRLIWVARTGSLDTILPYLFNHSATVVIFR